MNKTELIKAIATRTGNTKAESKKMLEAFMDIVGESLTKGEAVRLIGFGTFSVQERKARGTLHANLQQKGLNVGTTSKKHLNHQN